MGVPKFFRYISERYPCLSQLVLECEIPDFDNLYLDMNGIIHNCSHPGDYDPQFRISEEKIFKDIFHYIEILFRIIKPQKLFFMAVDGVAPRAKMNQQRGRRFRSAKETEERDKEVLRKGGKLPEGQKFDSNCITPGTSFMARLQAQLKFFVASKISSDKSWQNVKIILSGHECPGEGEHKIMDYIRYLRAQPDFDPNTRHCLYGLDADLIMLGLCTHEPHFALLREEVKFGKKLSKKILAPEETKFFLLHLSLMREYLEMEFSSLKDTLPFEFNLENIIDDWVLMGFLVGNDFIPNLPGLHISSGALPVLYTAYCEVLPTLDGYLNEGGTLSIARFDAYMKKLASFDIKQFREMYDDFKYMKQKTGQNNTEPIAGISEDNIGFRRSLQPYFEAEDDVDEHELNGDDDGGNAEHFDQAVLDMMDLDDGEGSDYYDEDDKEQDRVAFFQEFCLHKQNYYHDKLEYKKMTQEVLRGQAEGYIKAIQWNLNYYYNGLCSWSWFYPHHYAPYISDIQNFKDMTIEFDLGRPFLPFEQLLAVLPSFSKELLPEPFQELMTDETSPIFDYYPCDFQTDLNGKKNDWEAVVLIPFIDEKRLLEAMNACYHRLTDEEKERNKHGPMHVFTYTPDNLGRLEAPAYFNPIEKNHAVDTPLYREDLMVPRGKLQKSLLPGALTDVYFPGFPSFKHLKYTSFLEPKGVKIFQSPSQGLNMIVKIIKPENEPTYEELLRDYINTVVHVCWPYLTEAKVVGIKAARKESAIEGGVCRTSDRDADDKIFSSEVSSAKQEFLKSRGIDVGSTTYLIVVRTYEGQKFVFGQGSDAKITLEKKWSNKLHSFPLQTIVKEVVSKSKLPPNICVDDIFPVGCNCFLLNRQYYGCLGTVNDKSDNEHVRIRVIMPPEPEPHDIAVRRSRLYYYSNNEAAQRACIPNHLLARITGTILVLDTENPLEADKCQKVNIGLNLKFSRRNQQLPGYTKRTESNQWLYSDKTIVLIKEYADAFPEVIRYLAKNSDKDNIFKNDLFPLPGQSHMLNVISNWLDSKVELKTERRSCDADLLEVDVIGELESQIEQFMKKNKRGRYVNLKAKPFHLYTPSSQVEKQAPDYAEFQMFDRVVNVRDNFVVPLGYRGTVIGLEKQQSDTSMLYCDILFDQSFSSAAQYYTKKKRVYKLPEKCLLNITFAKERFAAEESKKAALRQKQQMTVVPPKMASGLVPAVPLPPKMTSSLVPAVMQPPKMTSGLVPAVPLPPCVEGRAPYSSVVSSNLNQFKCNAPPAVNQQPQPNSLSRVAYPSGGLTATVCEKIQAGLPSNIQLITQRNLPANFESANSAPPPKPERRETASSQDRREPGDLEQTETTLALKKLLKISDDKKDVSSPADPTGQSKTRPAIDRNENKGYVTELQELCQKIGKGNPKYEYQHVDGNFRATLHLPGIDVGISSDPAPTKKAAGEKAAFLVLQFLNLVQNYGDRVPPLQLNDDVLLDLKLQFLRLQHKLTELQRQQQPPPPPDTRQPQSYPYPMAPQDLDNLQSALRASQQQNIQMLLGLQPSHQPPSMPPTSMAPQHMIRPAPQFPSQSQQLAPFQAQISQQRQMAMATNYIFQQNVPSKYPMAPQQLYYQNVQNIYYNHPAIRAGFQIGSGGMPGPQWFQPVMPPQMNMAASMQPPRPPFFSEQMPQPGFPPIMDKPNMNLIPSNTPIAFGPKSNKIDVVPTSNPEPARSSQQQTTCSGRVSKTPKKNRLAANFATKAAT